MRHAAEAAFETDRFVIHMQMTHGTGRNIQDNLPVIGKPLRDLHRRVIRIDQHMRGAIVIDDPLIESTNKIRATGVHQRLLKP